MARTAQQQKLQYLFVCNIPGCETETTTDPKQARLHYMQEAHPYKAFPLPANVHLDGQCPEPVRLAAECNESAAEVMPAQPPAETLEQQLRLLNGLLEQLAALTDELTDAARNDPRIGEESDVVDWLEEMSLQAGNDRLDVHVFLEELSKPGAAAAGSEVTHG